MNKTLKYYMSSPRTEKFVAQNRLLRVPQSIQKPMTF